MQVLKGGLAITHTAIKYTSSNPVSFSAGLMYNPVVLDVLTPPCITKNQAPGGGEIMDWMNAPTKRAQQSGRNIGGVKTRMWISNPISFWALLEQIRSKNGFKDANETMFYCVMEKAKEIGLEI